MKFTKNQIDEACIWFENHLPKYSEEVQEALKEAHAAVSESYWKGQDKEFKNPTNRKALAEFVYVLGWRPKE